MYFAKTSEAISPPGRTFCTSALASPGVFAYNMIWSTRPAFQHAMLRSGETCLGPSDLAQDISHVTRLGTPNIL